ncbi:MAG: pectinesterase family protein, partial [Alistipes sp.]|nr:pectinesterase family protein [Alistipes sp.]
THIEGTDFTGSQFKTLYLGRPWKHNARVVFIRCEEPALLNAAAWCRMSDGVDAALFAEYKCTGEGAAAERLEKREMGGRQLSDSEAAEYTLKNIFSSKNNPSKYNSDWTPDIKFSL